MKLSIFTSTTYPVRRGDNYRDALKCYSDLADEVVIVDGGTELRPLSHHNEKVTKRRWQQEFSWEFIGKQFNHGYKKATGDWVIHCDIDMIFHQKDFAKIRQALKDYPSSPAVSFYKWQFIQPDRYNLKSRLLLAVNKKSFGDRITFSGGGDLCQPQLDGKDLDLNEVPQSGVAFYNYEHMLKTKGQVMDDVGRMDRAYFRKFGTYLYGDGTDKEAFNGWMRMVVGRYDKPQRQISLGEHPKYVQDTISNLSPDQFGYGAFGKLRGNNYVL